jgi:hypothetical protein
MDARHVVVVGDRPRRGVPAVDPVELVRPGDRRLAHGPAPGAGAADALGVGQPLLAGSEVLGRSRVLDQVADLHADVGDQLQLADVRLGGCGREELHDPFDGPAHADREPEGGAQARRRGGVSAREVRVGGDVLDPRGLAGLEDASGEPLAGREPGRPGGLDEAFVTGGVTVVPDVGRPQLTGVGIDHEDVAQGPPGAPAHDLDGPAQRAFDVGGGRHQLRRRPQDARDVETRRLIAASGTRVPHGHNPRVPTSMRSGRHRRHQPCGSCPQRASSRWSSIHRPTGSSPPARCQA